MELISFISVGILPVLQSIIGSRCNDSLNEWINDDKYEGDPFRKIMMDAFCAAVSRVKGDAPIIQQDYLKEDFDAYLDYISQELIKLKPGQRISYIEEDLYNAFKEEVLKRQDALEHVNLLLAQECLRVSAANHSLIEDFGKDIKSIKDDTSYLVAVAANSAAMSGFSACRIVDATNINCSIPDIHTKREQLITDLKTRLVQNNAILLYSGIKTGKTVTSCLLAKSFNDYQVIKADFQYSSIINVSEVLSRFSPEKRIIFVFDGIKFSRPEEYSAFVDIINQHLCDNWLFIMNSYRALSEFMFDDCNIEEVQLQSFSKEEVSEMIPEDKRKEFTELIFSLFEGHPLLTQMVCSSMHKSGWTMDVEGLKELLNFPNNTNLRKKLKAILQVENDDDYNLLNRLLLLNRNFTDKDIDLLASVKPSIPNPQKRIQNIVGKWVEEDHDSYRVSPLLQRSYKPDLLPQEKKNCCITLVDIILKNKDLTSADCLHVFHLLTIAEDYDRAASFYSFIIYKLSKEENFGGDDFSIFRMIWINCSLPENMHPAMKISVWMSHLILPDLKEEDKQRIYNNIDETLRSWSDNDELKKQILQYVTSWFVLNAGNNEAIKYLSMYGSVFEDNYDSESSIIKLLLIQLNKVQTSNELKQWTDSYVANGMPQSDMLCEGAIVVVNRLCDALNSNDIEATLIDLLDYIKNSGVNTFAAAISARLVDYHSSKKDIDQALEVYNSNLSLLDNELARILLNYSIGLALFNNGREDEGKSFIESACQEDNIAVACMVALNACCTLAQIYGNAGMTKEAVEVIKRLVENSHFTHCFSEYERYAAYGSLAFAFAKNGDYAKSTELLLKIEKFIWQKRFEQNDDFKNLAMRFDIVIHYIYNKIKGKQIDEEYIEADYGTFTKEIPNLLHDYMPLRNFTVEVLLLQLSDEFLSDNVTISIIEHTFDFQKEDALGYARMMSVLIKYVPLCLQHDRKDLVEYLVLTTLSGAQDYPMEKDGRKIDYESLIIGLFISYYSVFRVNVIESGKSPDDEWFFDLIDRAVGYLTEHQKTDEMVNQMLSGNTLIQSKILTESECAVATFNYRRISSDLWLNLLYKMGNLVYKTAGNKSAQRMMDEMIWKYSRYLIREKQNLFKLEYKDYDKYFSGLKSLHGYELLHKMIQGLFFNFKIDISLPKEIEDIVYD